MSNGFERKVARFLRSAEEDNVITQDEVNKLLTYLSNNEFENKGWFSLSYVMGMFGAIAISLGLVLLVAKNWYMFTDTTKIIGYLIILGGFHFSGVFLTQKGYEKTAQALHFCGAAFVIAGIGLMSQIFHLHSNQGTAFITWSLLILPLAVLLRSGPILLLSLFAFICWGNQYIDYISTGRTESFNLVLFNISVCYTALILGLFLKYKKSESYAFMQTPAMIGLIFILYCFGFLHYMRPSESEVTHFLIPYLVLLPSALMLVYLTIKNYHVRSGRYFTYIMWGILATIVLFSLVSVIDNGHNLNIKRDAFGITVKTYILPLIVSVLAWISYFAIAFWGVIHGALNHHRWMLNCNVVLIGVGAFTRFIDLVGSMMDTGIAFIICGIFLFAIGFALERWRRRLIANAENKGEICYE